jgi:Arc/MetJ family transcription regulator
MKTPLNVPNAALTDAMRFTGAETKREAVVSVLKACNRQQRVADLIANFGTLDFATNDEIEAGDLNAIALLAGGM